MNLLCAIFGHKPLTTDGWCGGVGYAEVAYETVDGINRRHLFLRAKCPRCGVHTVAAFAGMANR